MANNNNTMQESTGCTTSQTHGKVNYIPSVFHFLNESQRFKNSRIDIRLIEFSGDPMIYVKVRGKGSSYFKLSEYDENAKLKLYKHTNGSFITVETKITLKTIIDKIKTIITV